MKILLALAILLSLGACTNPATTYRGNPEFVLLAHGNQAYFYAEEIHWSPERAYRIEKGERTASIEGMTTVRWVARR